MTLLTGRPIALNIYTMTLLTGRSIIWYIYLDIIDGIIDGRAHCNHIYITVQLTDGPIVMIYISHCNSRMSPSYHIYITVQLTDGPIL